MSNLAPPRHTVLSLRHRLNAGLSLLVLSAIAFSAHAQTPVPASVPAAQKKPDDTTAKKTTAPTTSDAPADEAPTTVVVTAAKPEIQHKIDRDVYDVKQDPTAATGSAADVLNNVPAVTVDPDGTVGLRGNTNVQVYVNGKKSAQMQGDSRAFTLQSLSGDDIDSIEVIPNPSAAFGSDSAAGIINIVMKRGRGLKPQTSYNVVVGDQGRANIGFRTGKTIGKLTLNGNVSLNHGAGGSGGNGGGGRGGGGGPKSKTFSDRFRLDPTTGAVLREDQTTSVSKNDNNNTSANINGNYSLTDNDSLEGNFDYRNTKSSNINTSEILSYDGAHNLTGDRASLQDSLRGQESMNVNLTYDHRGEVGTTEDFKMQLSHSQNLSTRDSHTRNIYHQPARADDYSAQASKTKDYVDEFSGDWSHPLTRSDTSMQQIQLGWDLQHTVSQQYNYRSLTLATPVSSPESPRASAVNQYDIDQTLSAGYVTYEQKFGKLGFQAGLRVENMHQELLSSNPVLGTPSTKSVYDNVSYSPSLFVSYQLDETQQLKFTYSQKLQRPQPQQINPLIVLSDDNLTARSGNADLQPERTNKYELRYIRDVRQGLNLSGTLHYDSTTGSINSVTTFLTGQPDVLLYTFANSGSRQQTGADFNVSANTPDRKFGVNVSGTYNYVVTDSIDFTTHLPVQTKGPSSSVNLRVNYRPTQKDTLIFGGQYQGQQTSYQGYSTPVARLNINYTRQLIQNKMVLTVNASNFLMGPTSKRVTETSVARSSSFTYNPGASFMVSLRYTFGKTINRQRGDGPGFGGRDGGGRDGGGRDGGGGGRGGFGGGPPM